MRISSRKLSVSLPGPLLASLAIALGVVPSRAQAAGMPQLDFHDPYLLWQVVWGALIFAVFYIVLSRSALPRIARVLEHRRQRIEGDLDIARRARDDADHAVEELRRARHDAATQAQANIDRVMQEARQAAEAQAHEMNSRLNDDIAAAEQRIAAARRDALVSLPAIATETAQSLIAKLLKPAGSAAHVNDDTLSDAVRDHLAAHAG